MRIQISSNLGELANDLKDNLSKVKVTLSEQVASDSNIYIPLDMGDLKASVLIHSDFENGEVVWKTPYARRLYWNPEFNFSKAKNPNASGLWFEVAKSKHLSEWENIVIKGIK